MPYLVSEQKSPRPVQIQANLRSQQDAKRKETEMIFFRKCFGDLRENLEKSNHVDFDIQYWLHDRSIREGVLLSDESIQRMAKLLLDSSIFQGKFWNNFSARLWNG